MYRGSGGCPRRWHRLIYLVVNWSLRNRKFKSKYENFCQKMYLKMPSAKWQPFCVDQSVLVSSCNPSSHPMSRCVREHHNLVAQMGTCYYTGCVDKVTMVTVSPGRTDKMGSVIVCMGNTEIGRMRFVIVCMAKMTPSWSVLDWTLHGNIVTGRNWCDGWYCWFLTLLTNDFQRVL